MTAFTANRVDHHALNYPEKVNLGWAYPGGFAEYLVTDAQNALPWLKSFP